MVCKRRESQSHQKEAMAFLTRLKSNRSVNPDNTKNMPLETIDIPPTGIEVNLKKIDFVEVFRIVSKNEDMQY